MISDAEAFNRTLFTRDDQVMQQLNAGINAGQQGGGGKSLEFRRFGFNLDHGGVNGGLKVLVDDVQQNQGTQGHGQGYLGALKALSPELIQVVTVINGPFSAEYGDFSGLGVVHIRQRESLPDEFTLRLQGGSFNTGRGFFAYSPDAEHVDAYVAYEGSYTDRPFESPGRYRRDNLNANYTTPIGKDEKLGFRFLFGRNDFCSSGQLPVDLVNEGIINRFGFIDPTDGARIKLGTASVYYSRLRANDPREGRLPTGVATRANAHVTNGAGFAQENWSLWRGRLLVGGGVRYDEFRYDVADSVNPEQVHGQLRAWHQQC